MASFLFSFHQFVINLFFVKILFEKNKVLYYNLWYVNIVWVNNQSNGKKVLY